MKNTFGNTTDVPLGKVKFPIGVKLAVIIGTVVLVSLGTVTVLNSYFIGKDVQITAEENNLSANSRAADTVEDKLTTIRSNVFQLLDLINVMSGGRSSAVSKQAEAFFFERNQDIASVHILSAGGYGESGRLTGSDAEIVNARFFISNETDNGVLRSFLAASSDAVRRSCSGETIALNASPFFGIPVMSLIFPWKENGRDQTCVITFSIEGISDILGSDSVNTTFMINDSDELLLHPETDRVLIGESFKNHPLVMEMRQGNHNRDDSMQVPFVMEDGSGKKSHYYGAYQKLSVADIVMATVVPLDSVLEGVRTTRRNNIYLTGIVFFLSFFLSFFPL